MGGAPYKSAKEGGGSSFECSAFNHERGPMSRLQQTRCPLNIGQTVMYDGAASTLKWSLDGTQHSEQHHDNVSAVRAALATTVYTKQPCNK